MKKFWLALLLQFVFLIVLNVILYSILRQPAIRPVVYYEYLFVPFIFAISPKKFIGGIVLYLLLFFDMLISISHLYYLNTFDYLLKFPSLFTSDFPFRFWVYALLTIMVSVGLCYLLVRYHQKYLCKQTFKTILFTFLASLCFAGLLFVINHSVNNSTVMLMVRRLNDDHNIYLKNHQKLSATDNFSCTDADSSLAYKTFYHSNAKKQLLIILESWGMLENKKLLNYQVKSFFDTDTDYSIKMDSTCFKGSTTYAEARELMNKEGTGYYSVLFNKTVDVKTLAAQKNDDSYYTLAVQSFPGSYSDGYIFRTKLGFKEIKNISYFTDTLKIKEEANNHYHSVPDETVFDYVFKQAAAKDRIFAYCLTINTHTPFWLTDAQMQTSFYGQTEKQYAQAFPSKQTFQQYYRFMLQFKHLSSLINSNQFDEIVMVGDHAPPFIGSSEREFYSAGQVPALVFHRKVKMPVK